MPGIADLPLHHGRVPQWMLEVMTKLARAIMDYIIEVKGPSAVLAMLADPLWFQAFNNVIGMDWDSSGSTTVVVGILKRITWEDHDRGILVLGGKGSNMKKLPEEAERAGEAYGLDPLELRRASKIAARVDSAFLQDGYELYIHALVVTRTGEYIVVQQGMNTANGMARRYHVTRFDLEEPHSGVAGSRASILLNATASESREARRMYVDLVQEGPRRIVRYLEEANRMIQGKPSLLDYVSSGRDPPSRVKPYYRPIKPSRRLLRSVEAVANYQVVDERDLAVAPGLGPRVVRALALIADILYGVPTSLRDPLSHPLDPFAYSYAIGGKDGVPYPFDRETALKAYQFLWEAVEEARLGVETKSRVLARLRRLVRSLEANI
ncbi:MAG: DUF763 domain-containing protein [Desulfurococcales archaeon]|nr:DUF763 domain-containing protein [Desulfurococcales archaeon]